MSLTQVYEPLHSIGFFKGAHDAQLIGRMKALEALYDGASPTALTIPCENDEQEFKVRSYLWRSQAAQADASGRKKITIFLNGIFTTAHSNNHMAYALTQGGTSDVLTIDYPGKGAHSTPLQTKENYTPRLYASMLRDSIRAVSADYDDIYLVGYSHGARLIYDLYEHDWNDPKIRGVVIADMGPERPGDAAARRSRRNQHSPIYPDLTTAVTKLTQFFNGHGRTLPEDFVLQVINHNFTVMADGERCGIQFGYDPRSMFGYCDEIVANPRMNSWKGFHKVNVPMLFLLGADTNTVPQDLLQDMIELKAGKQSLRDIALGRDIQISYAQASRNPVPSPFYVLECEGTGHYPEPHRQSHLKIMADFICAPSEFSVRKSLCDIRQAGHLPLSAGIIEGADKTFGVLPLPPIGHNGDLLPFLSPSRIVPA